VKGTIDYFKTISVDERPLIKQEANRRNRIYTNKNIAETQRNQFVIPTFLEHFNPIDNYINMRDYTEEYQKSDYIIAKYVCQKLMCSGLV
jgi:hypothetical protein